MRKNLQLRRTHLTTGAVNRVQEDVNPIYVQSTIVHDPKYLPPSANDLYEVKAEIAGLKTLFLSGGKYLGDLKSWKHKIGKCRHTHSYSLPISLFSISEAIEKSKEIVNRPQDISDELGMVCTQDTWRRAMNILVAHIKRVWKCFHVKVKAPVISVGPKGSVDIYWKSDPYGLLLNVPADLSEPATYYGDDFENQTSSHTSGKVISTESINPGLFAWIAYMEEKQSRHVQ